ncbi:protein PTHB1-like [Anneissia japonica]|uniref:protein PTHB1-like n=1 Tax=Anneissia japonica TaxID=1529436 RepID=UPI001425798A|nr:protein PTHB1-like [Anneissia japonica]
MSLFKARDWWSAKVGSDEVFDQGSLCVACIDNKHPTHDKVIVGSLNGIVRIYDPKSHADDDKGQSMLLEMQLPQPILGLETGQFVSYVNHMPYRGGCKNDTMIILIIMIKI